MYEDYYGFTCDYLGEYCEYRNSAVNFAKLRAQTKRNLKGKFFNQMKARAAKRQWVPWVDRAKSESFAPKVDYYCYLIYTAFQGS